MPSTKTNTVVKDVAGTVRSLVGGSEYRERLGVVRMAVGQLGFTPEEMQRNIRAFIEQVKKDAAAMSDRISKELGEVVSLKFLILVVPRLEGKSMLTSNLQVLSSTNSPGFSLNGEFKSADSPNTRDLSTL